MTTAYGVQYPENMVRASGIEGENWAESTIHSVVDTIEDYARAKPVSFGLWALGIGFVLGWKMKPW
jgi:hypothetical protein